MPMKVPHRLSALVLLLSVLAAVSAPSQARKQAIGKLPDAAFADCVFEETFASPHYLKPGKPELGDRLGCTLELTPAGFKAFAKPKITLAILNLVDVDGNAAAAGFKQGAQGWSFAGFRSGSEPSGYDKLDTAQAKDGDDLLLTGTQREATTTPHGDNVVLPGISLLRIAPDFLVSVQLAFDPSTPEAVQAAVGQELDQVVRGIRPKSSKSLLKRIF